ncbi:phosphatase PAP2 family protein [Streptomyces sp. NPDC001914]|uniref:phosphatase PAP2 family protein n=1 Tax=Streptomyces sp. NPDC001914 TaxID=3364623 RepID=UPI00369D9547
MTLAYDGSPIDGSAYRYVTGLAKSSPSWLDSTVSLWSTYGLGLFGVLMLLTWWQARRESPRAALAALAVPVVVLMAYAIDLGLKLLVREDRPCRSLRVATLEACPAQGDWSFPSNHAAIAAAAAVALFFVSRRVGAVAVVAAGAMAASRVWVGVHYPHDVAAGVLVGSLVAMAASSLLRALPDVSGHPLAASRLGVLLIAPRLAKSG